MPDLEPLTTRPHMPAYGIDPADREGLLPWSWAVERLAASHNYWLATARPDGRPHVTPVWAVWFDDALFFSCAPASRKARNLAREPRCTLTTERADEAVIVEGVAEPADREAVRRMVPVYDAKYSWRMDPEAEGYFRVRPLVVFGFIETADRFAKTATRWRFP
jgi:PPOX class probable F420-dependent enzyme